MYNKYNTRQASFMGKVEGFLLAPRVVFCYTPRMSDVQQSEPLEHDDQPGKLRTMWHPLLVGMLEYTLGSAFSVRDEVSVGKTPLRVDILLIRMEGGRLSEAHRRELSALLPLLNRVTLLEFKGPTDAMERGDFVRLVGCAFLWHGRQREAITNGEMSLIVVAPTVTAALRGEIRLLGLGVGPYETGIQQVTGLPFRTWLVETDVMAERGEVVLSLVSRVFLKDRQRIIEGLERAHERLVRYVVQQVHQFRTKEDFALQYADSEYLEGMEDALLAKIMEWAPIEERLRGLPLEQVAAAFSDEEAAKLRELLDRKNGSKNR
jgi:hypothetical protein